MRIPGVHVLLTVGVVAVTCIGTVTAFTLTSSASPELDPVAPPPAVVAPIAPAPLPPGAAPGPAPAVAEPEADTDTDTGPDRTSDTGDTPSEDKQSDAPDTSSDTPKHNHDDTPRAKPDRPRADPNGTRAEKRQWACDHGFLDKSFCRS